MSKKDQGKIQDDTDGGLAGTPLLREPLRVLVGPSTATQFNTIKAAIFPIACFKVESIRFDFDSSVVKPELKKEMPLLAKLIVAHTEPDNKKRVPPLSIFGHADPVGNDDLNKALAGRRAAAIYGLLTRRAEIWEDLYNSGASNGKFVQAAAGDIWGTRSIQIMLNALPPDLLAPPDQSADDAPAAPLRLDGKLGPKTRERVRRFQAGSQGNAAGLATDGDPGPATRKSLYLTYMDIVCVDAAGKPFKIDPKEGFLASNADAEGKGDFQGCGEFNPVLLFSQADKQKFDAAKDKTERNEANSQNRRVMVLLFRPGAKVSTQFWPCPKAKEGVGGCIKRFWSDGEKRRSNGVEERKFEATEDTFACRFYQRLLTNSPCETLLEIVRIRLFDPFARPLPFAPCLVTQAGKTPRPDRASGSAPPPSGSTPPADNTDNKEDAFITLRNLKVPATVNVKWSRPQTGDGPDSPPPTATDEFEFEMDVVIDIPETDPEAAALTRLTNMGYVRGPARADDIREFQRDYKPRFAAIEIDGTLNPATQNAIKEVHDACDPVLKA